MPWTHRICAWMLLLVLLAAPPALGHGGTNENAPIHRDAAACLAALGVDLKEDTDRTTSCVVAYLHMDNTGDGRWNPKRFAEDAPTRTRNLTNDGVRFPISAAPPYHHSGPDILRSAPFQNPFIFSSLGPIGARLHLEAFFDPPVGPSEDSEPPGCLALTARLVMIPSEGANETWSEATFEADLLRPGIELDCPDDGRFAPEQDGTWTLDFEFPAIDETVDAGGWFALELEANPPEPVPGDLFTIRLVNGPDHRNRIVLPVEDAVGIQHQEWRMNGDDELMLRLRLVSPWGAHDLEKGHYEAALRGRSNAVDVPLSTSSYSVHDALPSYGVRINVPVGSLPDGPHHVDVVAHNNQETARDSASYSFEIIENRTRIIAQGPGKDQETVLVLREIEECLPPTDPTPCEPLPKGPDSNVPDTSALPLGPVPALLAMGLVLAAGLRSARPRTINRP